MNKADRLDAIYCMSRDFIVCNLGISITIVFSLAYDIISNKWYKESVIDIPIILALFFCFLSSVVFWIKAKRYAKMRVRTILRQDTDLRN